jgi:ASC-1-like (ASCH) protein
MHLQDGPFRQIESGEKTLELRVNDTKRRTVKIGDSICFVHADDESRQLIRHVSELHVFPDFASLIEAIPASWLGYEEADKPKIWSRMSQTYSAREIAEFGVVGIRLCLPQT